MPILTLHTDDEHVDNSPLAVPYKRTASIYTAIILHHKRPAPMHALLEVLHNCTRPLGPHTS
eukprot:10765244-Ditylum_brightwellii.AAC.1